MGVNSWCGSRGRRADGSYVLRIRPVRQGARSTAAGAGQVTAGQAGGHPRGKGNARRSSPPIAFTGAFHDPLRLAPCPPAFRATTASQTGVAGMRRGSRTSCSTSSCAAMRRSTSSDTAAARPRWVVSPATVTDPVCSRRRLRRMVSSAPTASPSLAWTASRAARTSAYSAEAAASPPSPSASWSSSYRARRDWASRGDGGARADLPTRVATLSGGSRRAAPQPCQARAPSPGASSPGRWHACPAACARRRTRTSRSFPSTDWPRTRYRSRGAAAPARDRSPPQSS